MKLKNLWNIGPTDINAMKYYSETTIETKAK